MADLNFGISNLPKLSSVVTVREGGDYTLELTDANGVVETNNESANILTVPPNASVAFPIGISITVVQYAAGQTTITPDDGVTIYSANSDLKLTAQYSVATLLKTGENTWYLYGDITT